MDLWAPDTADMQGSSDHGPIMLHTPRETAA